MDAPVAVVAGGSRGLGLLIARELLDRGHHVTICARTRTDLDRAVGLLSAHGPVDSAVCDVRDPEQVAGLIAGVEERHGPVEVLVTVAGVIQVGPVESMTEEHFRDAVDTMLWGPVRLARAVLPGMRERGHGRIGTVTSVGGVISPPHLVPYSVAKFGAVGFSEGLAAELAGTGVTSTTIVPGLMRTGSHERARFTGNQGAEYAWFGPAASLPPLTMSAERAARIMVDGVLAGRPRVELTPLTRVAGRVHGLAPATTVRLLGVVNRLLPSPSGDADDEQDRAGRQARRELGRPAAVAVRTLTGLGSRAARRYNQRGISPAPDR
ncbi:SDR family NAD(P)-dependent oxidoreductase [Ornithinimicrobium sp. F0845]|uniref:SDR family NAD(P)-dependent oxidoreductase n=1 Tax=Ornithinimicrobium sp. F0845 TaxID=2926412 RepID=UPI001FF51B5A|nr:SDR family NAD(P)-dependent oxidoreductase [Ornithinimicrobium sp. F0845]MCK0112932.1 SDR family NAD(P)-dependent oxidoreductase [Ornithinimicrobium sp. F0845]